MFHSWLLSEFEPFQPNIFCQKKKLITYHIVAVKYLIMMYLLISDRWVNIGIRSDDIHRKKLNVLLLIVMFSMLGLPLHNNSGGQIVCLIVLSLSPSMKVVWPHRPPFNHLHLSSLSFTFTSSLSTVILSFHAFITLLSP